MLTAMRRSDNPLMAPENALSGPSDPIILERALSFANEAMFTLDLQWRRVHTEEPNDRVFPMRVFADLYFFIVTLQRLRRAVTLACHIESKAAELRAALEEFDRSLPVLKVMRNVGEHFDEYARDGARRRHREVDRRSLQVGTWDGTSYQWLDQTMDLRAAREAARHLYAALRRAAD